MNKEELNEVLGLHRLYIEGCIPGVRADLSGADLSGADLRFAYLNGCTGNGREIKTIQCEYWTVTYTKDVIQIGCENHSIEEWFNFTDDEINEMDENALTFWNKYKDVIRTMAIDEVRR